jgi:hypothetical protein
VPQNRSGRRGEEKHLAPALNPTPAVHPYARRDAKDTAVIRTECTPLHIYFSLDFSLQFASVMRACSYQPHPPAIRVVLRERFSRGNRSLERAPRKTPPDCCLRAAAWQRIQEKNALTLCWAAAIVTHPNRTGLQRKHHLRLATGDAYED